MHASPTDGDPTFGCDLKTDELYTRNFIDDAKKKFNFSSIQKSKYCLRNNLKGVFLTHINDVPLFSKPDTVRKIKLLQDIGGWWKCSITFVPNRPITWKKLCLVIDDYHYFYQGTTKKIKSTHLEDPNKDSLAIEKGSTKYHACTIVFWVFGKAEHQGTVSGYDPVNKLYHIIHDGDDTEEY